MSMIMVKFTKNQLVFNAEKNMRKLDLRKIYSCILVSFLLGLTACSKEEDSFIDKQQPELKTSEEITRTEEIPKVDISQTEKAIPNEEVVTEPLITETDWEDYFEGINGAAVIYNPTRNSYQIYNQELALTQRSPCSTFKIISSLIALENGIIEPDNSTRTWSGERFWNEEWNRDIDFSDAFHASCVWYFREVIDEIGKDTMQEELKKLEYGNCDISDWAGRLNTNNDNPVLTGFWLESSLLISPKEQAEVMQRIFSDHSDYSEKTLEQLKQVMLLPEQNETDISIYGKTGMGKAYGIVVDSWYTGFADTTDNRIYFCVYLGETNNQNVSSAKAREIAIKIVSDYLD